MVTPVLDASTLIHGIRTPIFSGFTETEIRDVTRCLGVRPVEIHAGEILTHEGTAARSVGLVLDGAVISTTSDANGNRHLQDIIEPGDVFGEELLWDPERLSHKTITATRWGTVLFIGMEKIINPGGPLCVLRSRMVENLFHIMGEKNRKLQEHLQILSHKSLRARLSAYFEQQACQHDSQSFTLSFSRIELAEHLNADRAALSRELSRMKAEGLIDYHRSSFRLLR